MLSAYPYQNSHGSIEERTEDLLSRMTWEEKAAQLQSLLPFKDWRTYIQASLEERIAMVEANPDEEAAMFGSLSIFLRELPPERAARKANRIQQAARERTRLGIPPIIHDEGLHGLLANDGTSFPQSIGMASSWEPELLEEIAHAIGKEALTRGIRQLLSPTINIARDPRCGRTEETYGEDPYLTASMARAFVRGVQAEGVITTPKHYAANFVGDGGRDSNPTHFSERLLREVYLPAFEAAVKEAGALSIMAAYNSLDGIPCSANHWLLTQVLRDEWGFEGFVVSDYDSVIHILEKHRTASTKTEVAKQAVEAGLDVELPDVKCYGEALLQGIQEGCISLEAVDEAVRRVLRVKFRLGLFDDPFVEEDKAATINHCMAHQELALRMARQSLVLLKNEAGTLPISTTVRRVAVIGPLAAEGALGGYSWDGYPEGRTVTPLAGIQVRANANGIEVRYTPGCTIADDSSQEAFPDGLAEAVAAATWAEHVVLIVGNHFKTEGEGRDRACLDLPGMQAELIRVVSAVSRPTSVVLINGSAVTMTSWIGGVGAVLEAWYPGEKGGTAIAEALFGDINPGGKLPLSIPKQIGQLPLYYNPKPSGRSTDYVDLDGGALFPFGHGLSYTTFEYSNLEITPAQGPCGNFLVEFTVTNRGDRAGDEVAQLYIHDRFASVARPIKELKGFQRIHLKPGDAHRVSFTLGEKELGMYDARLQWVVEKGIFEAMVGSSSQDIRLEGAFEVV